MKKYAVHAAKCITEDAESTLQTTFEFRATLADELKSATSLKVEYDHLSESLKNLRHSNESLASELSPEDIETTRRMNDVGNNIASNHDRLAKDETTLLSLDQQIDHYTSIIAQLQRHAEDKTAAIATSLRFYESSIGVSIQESSQKFKILYEDINRSFTIKIERGFTLVAEDLPLSLRYDMRDPMAVCKMLYQARELLKV